MAQRVNLSVIGLPIRKKTSVIVIADYRFVLNPVTGMLDRVVNNLAILKADVDATDPTGGGGAAVGRIPIVINGVTKYIPYY